MTDNLFADLPDVAPAAPGPATTPSQSGGGGNLFADLPEVARGPRGGEHQDLVFQSLQDHGVSPVATAAILGDIKQESEFHPRLVDDGGTSFGLLQVGGPLFRQFEQDQARKGIKPGSPDYVYNQAPFVLDRFARQHPDRWQAMQDADSAPKALAIFRGTKDWGYGIAGKRYAYANDYQQQLSGGEIQRRLKEFPAIAGEPTAASAEAAGAGKEGVPNMGIFADLPQAKPEGTPQQAAAAPPELKDSLFADLPQAGPPIQEPSPAPSPPAVEAGVPPAPEEEVPSLPTIDLGTAVAAPQQPTAAPQPGLPAPAAEEQQQPPPTAAPLAPVAAGVPPAPTGFAAGTAATTAPPAPPAQVPSVAQQAPPAITAPTVRPAPPQGPLIPRSGAQMDQSEAKQLAQLPVVRNYASAIGETIASIPQMLMSVPQSAYQAAKLRFGTPQQRSDAALELLVQAKQMGTQQAQDLQQPPGSKAFARGLIQTGMEALPALEVVRDLRGVRKPPIQVASTREVPVPEEFQPKGATESDLKYAPPEQPQGVQPSKPLEEAAATTEAAPAMGGPGTPHVSEIPEPRVTGLRNAIVDEERAKRGWLPLMKPARVAMGETWTKAMEVIERNQRAGAEMVDDIRAGRKKSVDAVDHAVLTHERILVMNESAMEAERASDPHMTQMERDEARARWGVLEDRLNEVDQALREAGTVTGRALQFRKALIRDDYTFEGLSRKARAIKQEPLTLDESNAIRKTADEIAKAEEAAAAKQAKVKEKDAKDQAKSELKATRDKVGRTPKPANLDEQQTKLLTAVREHVAEGGSPDGLRQLVKKLAENYVRRGVNKLQPLTRALHEALKDIVPGITPEQVRDLFSGYGDFRPLSKDAIQTQLRDLRGQAQQAAKIKDMFEKRAPRKTGPERRTPTEHERRLLKMVNELKKKGGFDVTDPATQLKSALGAVKTRLKNQIEDLTRQLFTGERPVKKGGLEYDVETEKLRNLRDQVKQSLQDVSERPELTDAQRLAAATKAAGRNLDYWNDRLNLAKQGVFKIDRETGKPIADPHLDAIKAKITAVKAEVKSLHDLANPAKTPEERALTQYQARLFNKMADLQDRISRGDFAPRTRPPPRYVLDKETLEVQAQAERLKRQFDKGVARQRMENRGRVEKILDGISKWRRTFVLSWPTVLGKLTAASAHLIGSAPLEELARSPYRVLLPRVAEKAPAFGRGFHLQTEIGAITHTFKSLFNAAAKKFKTGQGDIDALYGDPKVLPSELKDFVSNLHGALKEPARQNEFFRRFQNRLYAAGRQGADITDPLVQTKIATQAYKDANAQIFGENNMVADFIKRGLSRFKQADKTTGRPTVAGKLAETAVNYELPVIKIPLNIIKRTFEYSFGVPTGAARLAWAMVKGLDKLAPEEADAILRNLSRGKVGAAALAYGYFHPTQFGGYYQPGEKRAPGDLAAAHARVIGLDIPPYLVHNPLLAQFQIGSTIRRVVDSKAMGKTKPSPGYARAIMQAYMGVIEETPLVRSAHDSLQALDIRERDRFFGQLMQSTVPGVVEWTAKHFDSDANGDPISRKPTVPLEYFEQAVPGLRQNVPVRAAPRYLAAPGGFAPPPPPPPLPPPPPPPPI
jgi:hypothetical protein